jgi:hypothetical protein
MTSSFVRSGGYFLYNLGTFPCRGFSSIPVHLSEGERRLYEKLKTALQPNLLQVEDISGRHFT